MRQSVVILFSLFLLYLTRRKMTRELQKFVRRLGGENRTYVWLWSLIFLPGTLVHELSHFLVAAMTGAKTGKIEIFPRLPKLYLNPPKGLSLPASKDSPSKTHLGYVQIQKLGPFRGFLVGTAPLLIGSILLIWLASIFKPLSANLSELFTPMNLLTLYFFFTIANSLFPSWSDVKQALPLIVMGVIVGVVLWLLGVSVGLTPQSPVFSVLESLKAALLLSVGLNIGIVALLWGVNKLLV